MTSHIFVPRNDPPTRLWRWDHRGWSYLCLYWPTDGEAQSHEHDLTGLCWKNGVVVARWHWGFKVEPPGVSIWYGLQSHNPIGTRCDASLLDDYIELPIPPAEDRTSALADMRHFYDTAVAPDTSSVTFPDTWTDPRVLAWCLHNRYKYRIKLARRGYFRKVDPRALWLELPDLFYDLYRKLH